MKVWDMNSRSLSMNIFSLDLAKHYENPYYSLSTDLVLEVQIVRIYCFPNTMEEINEGCNI